MATLAAEVDPGYVLANLSYRLDPGGLTFLGSVDQRVITAGAPFTTLANVGPGGPGGPGALTGAPQAAFATHAGSGAIAVAEDVIDQPFDGTGCASLDHHVASIIARDEATGLWRRAAVAELDPSAAAYTSCDAGAAGASIASMAMTFVNGDDVLVGLLYNDTFGRVTQRLDLATGQVSGATFHAVATGMTPTRHAFAVGGGKAFELVAADATMSLERYAVGAGALNEEASWALESALPLPMGFVAASTGLDVDAAGRAAVVVNRGYGLPEATIAALRGDDTWSVATASTSVAGALVAEVPGMVRLIEGGARAVAPIVWSTPVGDPPTAYDYFVELHALTVASASAMSVGPTLALGQNAVIDRRSVDATADRFVVAWADGSGSLRVSSIALDGSSAWSAPQTVATLGGPQSPILDVAPGYTSAALVWLAPNGTGLARPHRAFGILPATPGDAIVWGVGSELSIDLGLATDALLGGGPDGGWLLSGGLANLPRFAYWPPPIP